MKTALITLAIAIGAWIGMPTTAEAGPKFPFPFPFAPGFPGAPGVPGFHHSGGHGFHGGTGIYRGGVRTGIYSGGFGSYQSLNGAHCSTPYVVRTCEISRQRVCRTAYTSCGRPYTYHVTVVTYRDTYSNGTCRTYTRTY